MSDKIIDRFDGQHRFLSNFYEVPLLFRGLVFKNAEAAFHSQKCPRRAKEFQGLTASQSKRLGRQVEMRPDWDKVRDQIMYEAVFEKFSQNAEIRERLIATGDAALVEGNTWNDKYWGVCNGEGENHLGAILMRVRRDLAENRPISISDEEAYLYGENVAKRALSVAEAVGYDIPLVIEVSLPAPEVISGISERFSNLGVTRFVWLPQFGQNAEYLTAFKQFGWKVVDVVKAPTYKYGACVIYNAGFLMEQRS